MRWQTNRVALRDQNINDSTTVGSSRFTSVHEWSLSDNISALNDFGIGDQQSRHCAVHCGKTAFRRKLGTGGK
jgi:hypothetical protein